MDNRAQNTSGRRYNFARYIYSSKTWHNPDFKGWLSVVKKGALLTRRKLLETVFKAVRVA